MKLKKEVLQRLDNHKGLALVMYTLDIGPSAARDYIKSNSDNLTKAAMLRAIEKEFDLTEGEILETATEETQK